MPIETRTTLRTVMHRERFTRTTPLCKAKLDGPLTLEKCLTFQKDVFTGKVGDKKLTKNDKKAPIFLTFLLYSGVFVKIDKNRQKVYSSLT